MSFSPTPATTKAVKMEAIPVTLGYSAVGQVAEKPKQTSPAGWAGPMSQALLSAVDATTRFMVASIPTAKLATMGTNAGSRASFGACNVDGKHGDDLILCDSNSGGENSAHGSGRGHDGTSRNSRDGGRVSVGNDGGLAAKGNGLECIPLPQRLPDPRKPRRLLTCTPVLSCRSRTPCKCLRDHKPR